MKWLYIVVGLLAGTALAYFGTMYAASELGGEVAVLHRTAADGSVGRIRVWIVEDAEGAWIEHGPPDAPWMSRLARDPVITVERNGTPRTYRASPGPESHAHYHRLRRKQYGFASRLLDGPDGGADTCTDVPGSFEPNE